MHITTQKQGEETIISIEGRIDTMTTQDLQEEVMKAFQTGKAVILDFDQVEYISSAGLRTLLIGHKTATSKGGYMKITHVHETVMDVLQMTGFANVLQLI